MNERDAFDLLDDLKRNLLAAVASGRPLKRRQLYEALGIASDYSVEAPGLKLCHLDVAGNAERKQALLEVEAIREAVSLRVAQRYGIFRPICTEEISRADLLKMLGISTQVLNYRITEMGFPKPSRIEGRKQWFNIAQVDKWREKNAQAT